MSYFLFSSFSIIDPKADPAKTTTAGTTTYNYSSRGELLNVTLPNSNIISYDHDPMGRRIAKRVNGVVVDKYLWKDSITLLAVYDGNNNLISRFNYADSRMPVSMTYGGATYYLAYDQVGSLRAVTDNLGNIVKRIDYDSFGNVLSDSNPIFTVPFGFAGGLHDKETGLVRFGSRDYDTYLGKWTAKDPIDFDGGDVNLFGYVGNNPVNKIDPLGLDDLDPDDIPTIIPYEPNPNGLGCSLICNAGTKSMCYGLRLFHPVVGISCNIATSVACSLLCPPPIKPVCQK